MILDFIFMNYPLRLSRRLLCKKTKQKGQQKRFIFSQCFVHFKVEGLLTLRIRPGICLLGLHVGKTGSGLGTLIRLVLFLNIVKKK